MIESWEIKGGTLEFDTEKHIYYYDGIQLPSVTSLISKAFPNKYANIPKAVLEEASRKGTALHDAIEKYETTGEETDLKELRNYKVVKRLHNFTVKVSEMPVVISVDGVPVVAGRLDMITEQDGQIGVEDIKRTSAVDKNALFLQLNWYAIGYEQMTGEKISYLKCLHLREDVRKRIDIPLNAEMALAELKKLLEV